MKASVGDGPVLPMVHRLARIGGSGSVINDRTCHSNLMHAVGQCGIDDLVCEVPTPDSVVYIIKPTALLKIIFVRSPEQFRVRLGADADLVYKFWVGIFSSAAGRDFVSLHPSLKGKTPADLAHTVPLFLHEDVGPYAKRKSANIVSYSGVLGVGRDLQTRLLFSSEVKFSKEDGGVQDKASWSMFVREKGLLATGHDGNGDVLYRCSEAFWSFVMCFGKGDMQVICQAWGLPGYHEADGMCGWCLGNRSPLPHTDCRTNAGRRATSDLPNDLFVARVREWSEHPLNRSPFFNRYFPRGDNLPCLGPSWDPLYCCWQLPSPS